MPTTDSCFELACELIRRVSITPEDAGCLDIIASRLAALGFRNRRMPFEDVDNLWSIIGDEGPIFCFAGHTDVVPPGKLDDWESDPFIPQVRNGLLYGRGSADMKSSLAAMVVACERRLTNGEPLRGRVAFLLTSDEEGIATNGTVRVIEQLENEGTHIDWCVIGEPSSKEELGDLVRVGRRGSLNATLDIFGVQGHVAYPDIALNPIHGALPALQELSAMKWDDGSATFPPSSFQISNINAGTGATNVIPGQLRVLFNFRFNTCHSADGLQQLTEKVLDSHGLNYQIDWQLSGDPFVTETGTLVDATVDVISEYCGQAPKLSTCVCTSDGRFIAPYSTEIVELGPVNASIHKVDEHVKVEDLDKLSVIYANLMERLI